MIHAAKQMFSIEGLNILEVSTDSILIDNIKRKRNELDAIAEMTYEQVGQLSNTPRGLTKFTRAKGISYPVREGDHGQIFRKSKKISHLPGTEYNKVRRRAELLTLSKIWRDIPVPLEHGKLNTDAVLRHVLTNNNIWVDGQGGAGKTTLGQLIVEQLRANGKTVVVIAKTHSAVRRFGDEHAQTADKFLNWHVAKAQGRLPDCLFIEEISMIDLRLWGYVSTIFMAGKNRKCQIVLSGDLFRSQTPKNTWNGCQIAANALRNSDLLYELAQGEPLLS